MFGPYDNIKQLGQFIAYYHQILGVTTFSFYLLDISDRTRLFLSTLQSLEQELDITIRLVLWELDENMQSWDYLWDYGSIASLTDCVYSGMSTSEFTYIVDLDEFVVPKNRLQEPTTQALIKDIKQATRLPASAQNKSSDSFLFKNTFFCAEYNKKINYDKEFDIFKILSRQTTVWSHKLRAKMLVRPEAVIEVGHHRIHHWVHPNVSMNTPVQNQLASLQHYRACKGINMGFGGMGNPVLEDPPAYDDSAILHRTQFQKSKLVKLIDRFS